MKKIFAFSMILILCLGLFTACSSESTTTTEAPAGTEADKTEAAKTEAATTEAATEAPTEADDGKLTAHLTIIDKEPVPQIKNILTQIYRITIDGGLINPKAFLDAVADIEKFAETFS